MQVRGALAVLRSGASKREAWHLALPGGMHILDLAPIKSLPPQLCTWLRGALASLQKPSGNSSADLPGHLALSGSR